MGCRWTRSSISGFRLLGAPAGGSWLSDKVTSRAAGLSTLGLRLIAVVTGGSRFCGKLSSRAVWPSASGLRFLWAVAGSTRLGGKLTSRAACRDFGLAGGLGILFWRLATRWQTNVSPRFGIASYERAFDCVAHLRAQRARLSGLRSFGAVTASSRWSGKLASRAARTSTSGFRLLGAPAGGSWLSDSVTSRAAGPSTLG